MRRQPSTLTTYHLVDLIFNRFATIITLTSGIRTTINTKFLHSTNHTVHHRISKPFSIHEAFSSTKQFESFPVFVAGFTSSWQPGPLMNFQQHRP